jgi:hypothetical protein
MATVVAGALTLAWAAPAGAKTNVLYGQTNVGEGESVGVTVHNGRVVVVTLKLNNETCSNGESVTSEVYLQPDAKIRQGRFGFTAQGQDTYQTVTMRGHRIPRGYRGSLSLTVNTPAYTCESGRRTYRVR